MKTFFIPPWAVKNKLYPGHFLQAIELMQAAGSTCIEVGQMPTSHDETIVLRLPSVNHLLYKQVASVDNKLNPLHALSSCIEVLRDMGISILLDMGAETFFAHERYFDIVQLFAIEHNLEPGQLQVSNSNRLCSSRYADYCRLKGEPNLVKFICTDPGSYSVLTILRNPIARQQIKLAHSSTLPRSKRFISLNGRYRPHRALVCLLLIANGLLESSNISFLMYDSNRNALESSESLLIKATDDLKRFSYLRNSIAELVAMTPLELDVRSKDLVDLKLYNNKLWYDIPKNDLFVEAFFNISTETHFSSASCFSVTEKALKALLFPNPVVWFGQHALLQQLRAMGFRTFGSTLPEHYDKITEDTERIESALGIIQWLSEISSSEAEIIYEGCSDVFRDNYNYLIGGGFYDYIRDDFLVSTLPSMGLPQISDQV